MVLKVIILEYWWENGWKIYWAMENKTNYTPQEWRQNFEPLEEFNKVVRCLIICNSWGERGKVLFCTDRKKKKIYEYFKNF